MEHHVDNCNKDFENIRQCLDMSHNLFMPMFYSIAMSRNKLNMCLRLTRIVTEKAYTGGITIRKIQDRNAVEVDFRLNL